MVVSNVALVVTFKISLNLSNNGKQFFFSLLSGKHGTRTSQQTPSAPTALPLYAGLTLGSNHSQRKKSAGILLWFFSFSPKL